MNSNKVIRYLGFGFLVWGVILTVWLQIPIYPLFLVGICLILSGYENEGEN
ncbi:MAG: hypothetical protein ACFFEY_12230 [Candidatus Thorarchaeota archaeon]